MGVICWIEYGVECFFSIIFYVYICLKCWNKYFDRTANRSYDIYAL